LLRQVNSRIVSPRSNSPVGRAPISRDTCFARFMIPGIETIAFGFFSKAQSIYLCSHQYGDSMRRAPNIHPVVPGAEMVYSEHAGNINVDFD
jgi:hypothetical protein